ncbi:O-antigen ligase family protein [Crenothrix sp.]|uniref:O-antigen ligase family protein n=1 Tax=Crenothrix sp. TaxID=3100433 RepID=UPI00374CD01B
MPVSDYIAFTSPPFEKGGLNGYIIFTEMLFKWIMIKNKYCFSFLAQSPSANQFYFNMVLLGLPVFVIFWLPGVWVCLGAMIFLYYSHSYESSYSDVVKEFYKVNYYRYIAYSYLAYLAFTVISISFFSSPLKSIDNACIFLIWLAISPLMAVLKPNSDILGYGCLLAVFMAFLMATTQFHFFKIARPYGMYGAVFPGTGAIKFGDISLLTGVLSYILLAENKLRWLGALGALLGFLVCLYASARGGVLALMLCVLVWYFFINTKTISIKNVLIAIFFVGLVIFILNMVTDNHVFGRVRATIKELLNIGNHFNASIGVRFQMWQAAIIIFENNPIFGIGLNNFDDALLAFYKQGSVSKSIIKYSHAHNEYLCALATGGVIGFIITLALFFLPMSFFKTKYHENVWARAGFWGVCLMVFFALTDCVFDRRMTVMAFIVLISICISGNMSLNNVPTLKNKPATP